MLRFEPAAVAKRYPNATPAELASALVPVVYTINMRQPGSLFLARRFSIHDKDILYVSNSPFSDLQKLFALIGTLTAPAIQGVSTVSYIK